MTLKRLNSKPKNKRKYNNKFLRHPYRWLDDHKETESKIFIENDMPVQVDFKNINYEAFRTDEADHNKSFTS